MIRSAETRDIPGMIELAARKREEYEKFAPTFWRRAEDGEERQIDFFEAQLERPNTICLVDEQGGTLGGFLIAGITEAPPVYSPGSRVCMIDDFAVAEPSQWPTVGKSLLNEVQRLASERQANLTVVICGNRDEPKRQFLSSEGMYIASEWYVKP
jgi:GNAT superfamily N-acetyltransferase